MWFLAQHCFRNGVRTLFSGILLGFGLTLTYALAFAVYASGRSAWQIITVLEPGAGLFGTLIANTVAIFVPALVCALLLGIGAALMTGLSLLLVYGLLRWLNPQPSPQRAAWIGFITAVIPACGLVLLVQQGLGSYFAALWPAGFLFWLGWPCLLFVGAITWVSWRFGRYSVKQHVSLVTMAT